MPRLGFLRAHVRALYKQSGMRAHTGFGNVCDLTGVTREGDVLRYHFKRTCIFCSCPVSFFSVAQVWSGYVSYF